MLGQAYAATGIVTLAAAGLLASNFLLDKGLDASVSRTVPGLLGGFAFLITVVWLDPWTAIALSGALTVFILVLRLRFRRGLRGVRGSLPSQAWAEVAYAAAGTVSLAVGWGLLGDPWLGFLPIAFMAWGDGTAGLARATLWRSNVASVWPSLGMAAVCLGTAFLYEPYWIGAVGAIAATVAERKRPRLGVWWDDNAQVVAVSLTTMTTLTML